jgi:hypothetical protein
MMTFLKSGRKKMPAVGHDVVDVDGMRLMLNEYG